MMLMFRAPRPRDPLGPVRALIVCSLLGAVIWVIIGIGLWKLLRD